MVDVRTLLTPQPCTDQQWLDEVINSCLPCQDLCDGPKLTEFCTKTTEIIPATDDTMIAILVPLSPLVAVIITYFVLYLKEQSRAAKYIPTSKEVSSSSCTQES